MRSAPASMRDCAMAEVRIPPLALILISPVQVRAQLAYLPLGSTDAGTGRGLNETGFDLVADVTDTVQLRIRQITRLDNDLTDRSPAGGRWWPPIRFRILRMPNRRT